MTPKTGEPRVRDRRGDVAPTRRPHAAVSGLLVALVLAVLFAAWTWFLAGPFRGAGIDQSLNRGYEIRRYIDVLRIMDRVGQRAVALPILGVVAGVIAWRHRSMRPVLISVSVVVAVNLCVLVLKLWLGRGAPLDHKPSFFVNGQMYPSGHTSNIISVYGTAAYLVSQYTDAGRRVRTAMLVAVGLLAVIMTATSLLLRWHWFGDLIAGFLVGGIVLAVAVGIDRAVPFHSPRVVSAREGGPTANDPP